MHPRRFLGSLSFPLPLNNTHTLLLHCLLRANRGLRQTTTHTHFVYYSACFAAFAKQANNTADSCPHHFKTMNEITCYTSETDVTDERSIASRLQIVSGTLRRLSCQQRKGSSVRSLLETVSLPPRGHPSWAKQTLPM